MPRRKKKDNFSQRLINLISEPEFIKFENILGEPNFFKIVGRSHFERWHSAFFGWLLDAQGSHLLSDYVLRRFLMLLLDVECLNAINSSEEFLINTLPIVEFSDIQVFPNENSSSETSVAGVGRFDVFLTANFIDNDGNSGDLNIIFEFKIDSKPNAEQSEKYANWLFTNHPGDENFLIYVLPELLLDAKSTVGDDRWHCLNYQLLNDKLLVPILSHPNLNEKAKPFIIQYVKNLQIRYKGIKMAITDEEKRLALTLYEKYSDVFDSIYDALVSVGAIDSSTSGVVESKGRETGRLAVKVGKKVFSNETVRLLFENILRYIVDNDFIVKLPLPWGSSKTRYIVTNEDPPIHPNGRAFFYPVSYNGYTIESHYPRDRALKVLSDLCKKLEIEFEAIET